MADEANDSQKPKEAPEPKTFDEAYVKQLRDEAAGHRVKAKELADRLAQLETSQKESETAKLTEHQQFKELAEKLSKDLEDAKQQIESEKKTRRQLSIQASIQVEASKLGIVDVDAAMKLADLSGVEISETGEVKGVQEALQTLIEAKPYLKSGKPTTPSVSPTNPSGSSTPENPVWGIIQQRYSGKGGANPFG